MRTRFLGALLLALALPLGGCENVRSLGSAYSTVTSVKVTKTQAYVAANAFNAVEATATNYILLPTCRTGQTFALDQCSSKSAIAKIVPVIRAGRSNRDSLLAYVKTNPNGIGASGLYTGVTSAIATVKVILKAYGVSA